MENSWIMIEARFHFVHIPKCMLHKVTVFFSAISVTKIYSFHFLRYCWNEQMVHLYINSIYKFEYHWCEKLKLSLYAVMFCEFTTANGLKIDEAVVKPFPLQVMQVAQNTVFRKRSSKFDTLFIHTNVSQGYCLCYFCVHRSSLPSCLCLGTFWMLFLFKEIPFWVVCARHDLQVLCPLWVWQAGRALVFYKQVVSFPAVSTASKKAFLSLSGTNHMTERRLGSILALLASALFKNLCVGEMSVHNSVASVTGLHGLYLWGGCGSSFASAAKHIRQCFKPGGHRWCLGAPSVNGSRTPCITIISIAEALLSHSLGNSHLWVHTASEMALRCW